MYTIFAAETNVREVTGIFEHVADKYFNWESIVAFILFVAIAFILGRIVAAVLRRVIAAIGRQADKSDNLQMVNRLRRYETMLILSIAIIRTFLFLFAIYFWWVSTAGSDQQPTGIIGASALAAILIGGALSPMLRDISSGGVMMAEQWYAVGDHVKIEPFAEMQGVVERVTLRSTRIRGLNGEVIWVNNQHIQGVRITPRGIRTMAIELFVNDLEKGEDLIDTTNRRLPNGPLLVISPLNIMTSSKAGENLWHITAIAETAPGREWLIEKYAIDVMKEINEERKLKLLAAEPVARFADGDAERRFARAIQNARKAPKTKRARTVRTARAKKSS
ncbi:MAG: mechanosensitive ion channel MscS, small conductance mechanosensitive channel [Candidatus Saccharibacteria bacterium]|nr:mechanosensitive ion channel MscS, small conductance mechanosensitive channel [Candidatus Saccharibacteria bacterium]